MHSNMVIAHALRAQKLAANGGLWRFKCFFALASGCAPITKNQRIHPETPSYVAQKNIVSKM
jgi:hypothetical protein